MTLNQEQLLEIKTFIEKKGFTYIDVQMEILDHIASLVEEKLNANPNLSFADATAETYKSFGITGLHNISNEIISSINKRYSRYFWKSFASLFGFRYILISCFFVFAAYKMLAFTGKDDFYKFNIIWMLVTTVGGLFAGFLIKDYKKYLSFKSGISFLSFLMSGLFFTNLLINKVPVSITVFSLNAWQVAAAASVVLFAVYFISAFKTAKTGMNESKSLIEKYKILYA